MKEEELNILRQIKTLYELSICICDPIEFMQRKVFLLEKMAEFFVFVLKDYEQYEKETNTDIESS